MAAPKKAAASKAPSQMTGPQQVREAALEFSLRLTTYGAAEKETLERAKRFEAYILNGDSGSK